MYPILILREELICLVILVFLLATSRMYKMGKDGSAFVRLIVFAIIHVIFDIITVWTVNHLDTTPHWLNYLCHIIFYYSAIFFSNEICQYLIKLCYPHAPLKRIYFLGLVLPLIYLCCLPFLPIEFVEVQKMGTSVYAGTNSSTGPAAYVGYSIAFLYFIGATILIILNHRKLNRNVIAALLPMMALLIVAETGQVIFRELLFTGGAITIVSVGFFFSLENPIHVFERKAMTDALTGVRSRHSYDMDIEAIDAKYDAKSKDKYIFVFCDINNLRSVNGLFGHQEGDNYITLIATVLSEKMRKADRIYRMGGDEFLVMYKNIDEDVVMKETNAVAEAVKKAGEKLEYTPGVAMGYAVTGSVYKSIRDALRTADYMMYKNKTEMKRQKSLVSGSVGTRLNLTGLTNRLFDAMCASNDKTYPFITNMETGVTRVSAAWADFFELPNEFFADFNEAWTPYIHPDDRHIFVDDIRATLTGEKPYHECRYRAKTPSGRYVMCTCRGGIFHGHDDEPDIFAGYLTNHGIQDEVDAVTGLRNFEAIDEEVSHILRDEESAIVMKMNLNNFARINMLHGYDSGDETMRILADKIRTELDGKGEAFRQDSPCFTILMKDAKREEIEALYERIRSFCLNEVILKGEHVEVFTSAGAYCMTPATPKDKTLIRSSLIYVMDESRDEKQGNLVFYN